MLRPLERMRVSRRAAVAITQPPFKRAVSAARRLLAPLWTVEDGFLRLGPELVFNGSDITDTSGWSPVSSTIAAVDGGLQVSGTGASARAEYGFSPSLVTLVGRKYVMSADVVLGSGVTSAQLNFCLRSTGATTESIDMPASGPYRRVVTAQEELSIVKCRVNAGTGWVRFSRISLREILSTDVWQDSAGTIPAAIGSTVGLLTDRSFGGELGAELVSPQFAGIDRAFTNQGLLTNVITDYAANTVRFTQSGTASSTFADPVGSVFGSNYTVGVHKSFAIKAGVMISTTSPGTYLPRIQVIEMNSSGALIRSSSSIFSGQETIYTVGADCVLVRLAIAIAGWTAGQEVSVDMNIGRPSFRELKGIHLAQSTAGARMPLGIYNGHPMLGPCNGTSHHMIANSSPIGSTPSQSYTIVCAGVVGALGGDGRYMCGDFIRAIGITGDGYFTARHEGPNFRNGASQFSPGDNVVVSLTYDGVSRLILRVNGAVEIDNNTMPNPTGTALNFRLGHRGNAAQYWNNYLDPFCVAVPFVMSDADRKTFERAAAQRVGATYLG